MDFLKLWAEVKARHHFLYTFRHSREAVDPFSWTFSEFSGDIDPMMDCKRSDEFEETPVITGVIKSCLIDFC